MRYDDRRETAKKALRHYLIRVIAADDGEGSPIGSDRIKAKNALLISAIHGAINSLDTGSSMARLMQTHGDEVCDALDEYTEFHWKTKAEYIAKLRRGRQADDFDRTIEIVQSLKREFCDARPG
jgi:hypothetical protein